MGKFVSRTASGVVGLALAVSGAVTAELPASAATGCSVTFSSYQTISKGSTGSQAAAVECLLARAGYQVSQNRSISSNDADQILKFRKSVGLDGVRAVGRYGWTALISHGTRPSLRAGAKGKDVLRLRLSLRAGGFSGVPATSTLDAATVKALKTAQKTYKLPQSGAATAKTWQLLQSGHLVVKAAPKAPAKSSSSKGERALAYAKKQLGEKYRYGAAGPNAWDCSGLTMKAWSSVGVTLPHSSRAQFSKGKKVSKSQLKKGDLVFFYSGISHVGIYAGNGEIIHASRPGKPVAYIPIKYMPYQGARRPG